MPSALLAGITLSVLRSVVDAFTLEGINAFIQTDKGRFYSIILWLQILDIISVGVGSHISLTATGQPVSTTPWIMIKRGPSISQSVVWRSV